MEVDGLIGLEDVKIGMHYILTPDGLLYNAREYETDDEGLKSLIRKEVFKEAIDYRKSPHIKLLKKLKLADNEPYTDAGHLTYLPRGALILDLLMDYALNVVRRLDALPVHTSIMYDLNIGPIKEHAKLFGQRMYKVKPAKRKFILRYAACFGQFALLRRYYLSETVLPLKIFELADSYRYEQRGEIKGLARVRRFYMPDMHVIAKDLQEAMNEFINLYNVIIEEGAKFGWKYYSLYNITLDFLKEYFDFIKGLVKIDGKPVLLYIVEPNIYYWVINIEFHYIDSLGKPLETATVQIDIGNSKRFNIVYHSRDGSKKYPVIIHTAIHGSIERFMFEFLEEASKMQKNGLKPMLPVWLSPVQVRVIPVDKRHHKYSLNIVDKLESEGFRVDFDDRDITLSRKIKDAESEWVPYIVVIGDKEVREDILTVRVRNKGLVELEISDFIKMLNDSIKDFPKRPLYFSRYVSRRPIFT